MNVRARIKLPSAARRPTGSPRRARRCSSSRACVVPILPSATLAASVAPDAAVASSRWRRATSYVTFGRPAASASSTTAASRTPTDVRPSAASPAISAGTSAGRRQPETTSRCSSHLACAASGLSAAIQVSALTWIQRAPARRAARSASTNRSMRRVAMPSSRRGRARRPALARLALMSSAAVRADASATEPSSTASSQLSARRSMRGAPTRIAIDSESRAVQASAPSGRSA